MKQLEMNVEQMHAALSTCACSGLRRMVRLVTSHFDKAFEPTGLKCSQITVLMAAAVHGPATIRTLSEAVVLDASSMSRALDPLERDGLIVREVGQSRRDRLVVITDAGKEKLMQAGPLWQQAQMVFCDMIGSDRMEAFGEIMQMTDQLTEAA